MANSNLYEDDLPMREDYDFCESEASKLQPGVDKETNKA